MEPARLLTVPVSGTGAQTLAPTWGLSFAWRWHGDVDEESQVDTGRYFGIPDGCDLGTVANAIGRVFSRHQALRTVFRPECGQLRQIVEQTGEVTVYVYEADKENAQLVSEKAVKDFAAIPWDGRQWPLRMAVILQDDHPAYLALAHNRLVLEGASVDLVRDEVLAACAGRLSEQPPRWQVADETRFQQSPEGQAISARALERWQDVLQAAPPSVFDYPPRQPEQPRYALLRMESAAAARAVQMLRKRWRVTGGTLVLSALAAALGQYTGHSDVVFELILGNRADRNRRLMVGALASVGLLHFALAGSSFEQIVRKTASESSVANQTGYCDPEAVLALQHELELRRGVHLDLGVYFNDLQTGQTVIEVEPEISEEQLRELARLTGISESGGRRHYARAWSAWQESLRENPTKMDVRLFAMVQHGSTMPVVLLCDTTYLSSEAIRQLLTGVERLLIAAACGNAPAGDLGRITGITQVRREGSWVRCPGGWVDLAATRELWLGAAGADSGLVAEELPSVTGEHRLIGYLTGAEPPAFTTLHQRLVTAIGVRNDVRAPDVYRWVKAPPDDTADASAWRGLDVLAQADGR
jgi:Condensation domain